MPYKDKNKEKERQRGLKKRSYLKKKVLGFYISIPWKFIVYKKDAKARGYSFELSKEEFSSLCGKKCAYCGDLVNVGVDRIDNKFGYVIGNVVTCCSVCNRMKNVSLADEFVRHCKKVSNNN